MFNKFCIKQTFQAISVCLVAVPSVACSDAKTDSVKVVVIGGGSGGIGVTAQLAKEGVKNVTIVDGADAHFYQPAWTLVGGGIKTAASTRKDMRDVIPKTAKWVQQSAREIQPGANKVVLEDGTELAYDYLVVAAGLTTQWDAVPGMKQALEDELSGKQQTGVVSIYDYRYAPQVHKQFDKIKSGRCLFTMPNAPIKCPGAPQKIMWLFEDHVRKNGYRDKLNIEFWVPGGAMFGVPKYAAYLGKEADRRGVERHFKTELVAVDGAKKTAQFKDLETGAVTTEKYDLLHVSPPMGAPAFLKKSPSLVNAAGFVDVDHHSLQSKNHPNVFAVGDCAATPNSKSAAAITSQAPVVVHNLVKHIKTDGQGEMDGYYSGYGSCPLVLAKGRAMLAEFGYAGKIMETFDEDTGDFPYSTLGQWSGFSMKVFYYMKEHLFPFAYWNLFLSGNWYGPKGPFKPDVTVRPPAHTEEKK